MSVCYDRVFNYTTVFSTDLCLCVLFSTGGWTGHFCTTNTTTSVWTVGSTISTASQLTSVTSPVTPRGGTSHSLRPRDGHADTTGWTVEGSSDVVVFIVYRHHVTTAGMMVSWWSRWSTDEPVVN